jgi:uncharacterized Tic20 family protein
MRSKKKHLNKIMILITIGLLKKQHISIGLGRRIVWDRQIVTAFTISKEIKTILTIIKDKEGHSYRFP